MAGHVPKKTMIDIGPTEVGKSTFCNVIAGRDPMDNSIFPVSDSGESCTNKTSSIEIEWGGSGGLPVLLIDTPGLSDSSEDDFKNISGMLKELEKHSEIHVFVLTVNGTQLSFSKYFKDMILIFGISCKVRSLHFTIQMSTRALYFIWIVLQAPMFDNL